MNMRLRFQRAAIALALWLCAAACVGPSMPPGASLLADEYERAYREIRENPARVERYSDLIRMQLSMGDPIAARESGEYCTEHNPSDPRAWLVRADVERTLLDLRGAERSLRTAFQLDSRDTLALKGLASLYADVGDSAREAECREELVALAAESERNAAKIGLALVRITQGHFDAARVQLRDVRIEEPGAWLGSVRLALLDGDDSALRQVIEAAPARDDAYFHTLLRLVALSASAPMLDVLRDEFASGLETHEDPTMRFVCLLGLWEIGWVRSSLSEHGARPADHSVLWGKLDQIDATHPEWRTRLAMVVLTAGDERERAVVTESAAAGKRALPPAFSDLRALRMAWAAEDALRMGVAQRVIAMARELGESCTDAGVAMLELQVLLACGHLEEAITVALAKEPTVGESGIVLALLRFKAAAQLGRSSAVLGEMDRRAAELKPWMAEAVWIRALAAYFAVPK